MNRLTRRGIGGTALMDCDNCEIRYREGCCSKIICANQIVAGLADYEDAEEQGRLVPVVRGFWTRIDYQPCGHDYKCSECHDLNDRASLYCPNCGADMREVEHE